MVGRPALLGLALLAAGGASGCGLLALGHDAVLGSVSPVGRVHDPAVGRGFHVTPHGPVADAEGEARLRPFPADLIHRLGSPSSFRSLVRGLQALAVGTSVVVERHDRSGKGAAADEVPERGASAQEVLGRLGVPDVWLRRSSGSVMAYRRKASRDLSVNLGMPPIAAGLVPIPGLSNLAFRYGVQEERSSGIVLFFGADDRLLEHVVESDETGL